MTRRIYHIAIRQTWDNASGDGQDYAPAEFATERFIHCSNRDQVVRVANARFGGRRDLVLLEIDCDAIDSPIVDEDLEGGSELFPHVYGKLPLVAVVAIHDFECDQAGVFSFPERQP